MPRTETLAPRVYFSSCRAGGQTTATRADQHRRGLLRLPPGPGLFGTRGQPTVFRVADLNHGESLGWHHLELASTHPFVADADQSFRVEVALPDRDAGPHQRANHAVAERIRFHLCDENAIARALPAKLLQRADGGRPLPRLAEGGPVVEAEQRGCRLVHQVDVEGCRIPDGVPALDRVARRQVVGDPVLVPAPDG